MPAIGRAFAADLCAQLAMLVIVLLAFGSACLANAGAKLEHVSQNLFVRTAAAQGDSASGFTDVRAVEAAPDALRHVHFFGGAGVRAAEAHLRAIHQVVDGIAERLIHMMALHIGMQCDHFANGH